MWRIEFELGCINFFFTRNQFWLSKSTLTAPEKIDFDFRIVEEFPHVPNRLMAQEGEKIGRQKWALKFTVALFLQIQERMIM